MLAGSECTRPQGGQGRCAGGCGGYAGEVWRGTRRRVVPGDADGCAALRRAAERPLPFGGGVGFCVELSRVVVASEWLADSLCMCGGCVADRCVIERLC